MRERLPLIALCLAVLTIVLAGSIKDPQEIRLLYLQQKVYEFANMYKGRDTIIVSKKDHLLYYCRNGKIVQNENWNGFTYNFPVKVALAGKNHWTPEGEMFVDGKNPQSQYILFLSLSTPGDYGIHSAPTRYKAFLDAMEKLNPHFIFATIKDDTRGCIQVENRVIKYLYANVDVKTPVLVLP